MEDLSAIDGGDDHAGFAAEPPLPSADGAGHEEDLHGAAGHPRLPDGQGGPPAVGAAVRVHHGHAAEFAALADAVSALNPWLWPSFETAAACDLLLSCVLDGDQALATDVLTEPSSGNLAKALLRWAITGELPPRSRPGGPLLSGAQVALLGERAAALAASDSPDAWVGEEILQAYGDGAGTGGQPS